MNDLDLMINCQWDCNYPMLFSTKLKSMRNLCPLSHITLQILLQLLIINYFKPFQIEPYLEELRVNDPKTFLTTSVSIIQSSVEKYLNFDSILEFLNFLFKTINNLEKDM